ncbi:stabilin-2 [Larimichthys crocea]|uniref:stabilin-2 n=1 Tax=Larimichthys crocea TaxID=215358 RepID=UPI000F5D6A6D|nr:stabilin-2 [Larimichthys crocea]WPM83487.1 STAB2 [Larimichthys crocea]
MQASLKLLFVSLMIMMMKKNSAAAQQNLCSNSTVLRTRTACHSCSISLLIPCPSGFRQTPRSLTQDCKYYIRTPSMKLPLSGCSFECYKEVEVRTCCPGFWGPDCLECPDQADRPCSDRGVCSDGAGGNGTCSCQVGFAGTACEDCAPGRYGPTCSSVCSCVHGLCDSGLRGSGSCTCFSGYKGPNCDQELPECAALSCQQNSRCMEEALTGHLVCQCLPGYQKFSDQCLSINPCLQRVCHVRASCVHTGPNQHRCTCNEGYSGDGRVCMAIDQCQTGQGGCSAESTRCVYDGPGMSHCECLPGFHHLSNGSCSRTDVCRPDSCDKNAKCSTVGTGQVECTCLQGYLGNGKVCYGNIIQRLNSLNTEPGGQWSGQLSNAISLFGSVSWSLQNLGPFTLFVPINKGFRGTSVKTLTADQSKATYLCKMHLVAGVMPFDTLKKTDVFYTLTGKSAETDTTEGDALMKIRIHGSRKKGMIAQSDIIASNGMIHIINKLMDSVAATVESNAQENLMKIVSDYGKFDKFESLLQKTELASVLDRPGPITIFAPSSSAFDAMTEGHLQHLSSPEGHNKLVELLRNHIVPSTALDVFNAVSSPRIVTMANQVLTINVTENGQILVNGAVVLEAAVEAKNGRLYVLDGVLTPSSIKPVLPHRCDINETKAIKGPCVSCSKLKVSQCSSGVFTGTSIYGCLYIMPFAGLTTNGFPATGCSALCNTTVTTPACCKGFYGPDCTPCPGGYLAPCSGRGQCLDGIGGNGSCLCDSHFRGSRCQYCSSPNKYGPNCDRTCPCIHGQCDNRPDSDGRCKLDSCQTGFTGRFCERRTSACGVRAQFCHAHADCDFSDGTVRCVCKPGFQGDGVTCVESDPCAPPHRGGCSMNAKCIKTGPGSHSCQCLAGWREDGDECQPINNCNGPDRGGCHPNATCIYVGPGQSDCSCKSGYKGNGRMCEAVNQCVTAEGGCHYLASCRLLSSGWTCICDENTVGDGHICYGTVEQELMALPDAGEFFTWTTQESGLTWSLVNQNITVLVPSSAAIAKMSPEDKKFWTLKGNLLSLIRNHIIVGNYPISIMSNSSSVTSLLKTTFPVSTTNELTAVGGATITTTNIAATNGLIHIIDKVLVPGRKLSEGLLATLALQPDFSLFRSYLIDYNLTDEIEEADEFTVFAPTDAAITDYLKKMSATALDVNTTRYHVVSSERLLKTDLQPGGYKETLLGFSFQIGIFPRDGKLFVNDAQIDSFNILSGNGVIQGLSGVLRINRNRCDEAKYNKVMGTCVDCLFPQGKICPNDTIADKSVKKRKCMFTRMFEEERLLTIGCRATCLQRNIVPRCCPGFFGEHCEPCPGPDGQPCFGNGLCLDGTNGTGVCQCSRGFNGTACETCQSGKYGVHCDQECGCKNGRCNEGLEGDGTCECDVGWRGVLCNEKIESTADELCGSVKCHTSANCVIELSAAKCLCAAGFQGNGTFCEAVDPCLKANGGCSLHAVCKRTRPGRRDCVCISGYSGDGLVCIEINPCLEGNGGCHGNAACVHVGPNKTSCVCSEGYSGDGRICNMINLCRKKNGGCHEYARCNMTGPGVRTCTCMSNFIGDGVTCRGTLGKEILKKRLRDFYLALMMVEVSLKGRGPFTVFVPNADAFAADRNGAGKMKSFMADKSREQLATILRSHIVMCHTLLPTDLSRPRNLTSLSGVVLTTRTTQGSILVNQASVTYSDDVSINGIFYEINKILFPPNMDKNIQPDVGLNLTDVAERNGYKTFYKLLEDTGVMDLVSDGIHQPVTVFLPSDGVMASLPQEQKDFLFHQDNRAQLVEYLKYHILQAQKVYAEALIHVDSARTLQGSPLSFLCGGTDDIGEIFVNDGKCRIVQRHLIFNGGIAYGINCLLTPPSLGGRCDEQTTFDFKMTCGMCTTSATRCPRGSKQKEVQKCDLPTVFVTRNSGCLSVCTVNFWQPKCCHGYYGRDCLVCPGGVSSPCSNRGKCDDGHLGNGTCTCDVGFGGVACELCSDGFYGASCKACNCSEHGSCDAGRKGTGLCFCEAGWTGEQCEIQLAEVFQCSPSCSPKAVCQENNTCVCQPFYEGDGFTCTVVDMCQIWNGGCAKVARCAQKGESVVCTCPKGYSGDGFTCQPIDRCASGDNGGCHEHATCTMTGPGKSRCTCKDNYLGDGVTCDVKQLPISRCLQDNGQCHQDAKCTDLHSEDAYLGVFHYRSVKGQYKLTYAEAQQACSAEGGSLATYNQLSYAQQGGLNMCAAGWLDQARVAYPTTYSSPQCGFGHVGIVDYGTRKDLEETWDTFCYRMKEVTCECKPGYVGDGFSCTGNLLQVLQSTATFSNFLTQVLNYSQVSESGKTFMKRLSNLTVQSTLFVPDNDGLPDNQTLSQRDIEFHLSEGQALPVSQLKNGSRIRTRAGSLSVLGVADLLNPLALSSRYINDRFVTESDILASNGIIHVLQGPLKAPPLRQEMHVAHKAGMGVGVVLLIVVVVGAIFVGYHFYSHKTNLPVPLLQGRRTGEEESPPADCTRSICNPFMKRHQNQLSSTHVMSRQTTTRGRERRLVRLAEDS